MLPPFAEISRKGDGHKEDDGGDEDRVEYIVIGCHKFVTPAI